MTAFVPVIAALAMGWGLWRRFGERGGAAATLAGSTLAGIAALLAWMALLDLAGLRWGAGMLLAPAVPALVLGSATRRSPARPAGPSRWALVAAVAAALRVATVAAIPAFGWDFRYIWGLKGRVFALAGAHDTVWLAWPGHLFAHPSYPPAWCDLIASGVVFGVGAEAAAAAWQALLAAALAAACWAVTAGAPPWLRALAAGAAAWSPVLFDPLVSGNAEPLLAFLAATGLGAVQRLARGERRAMPVLVAACALLALTKNEGGALAIGLVVATGATVGPRRALPVLAAVVAAVLAWQGALPLGLAAADARATASLGLAAAHAVALPGALLAAIGRTPVIAAVLAAWLACLALWWDRELRGVRLACGLWALAVAAAYLLTTSDLTWHLATSADRVLAVPLPGVLAAVAASRFTAGRQEGARPSPDRSRGG